MRVLGRYFVALGKRWWALMSCALFTFISYYAAAHNKGNSWIVGAIAVAGLVMFFVASFLAWKEQYERAAEERRPKFILETSSIVSHYESGRTLVFLGLRIINAGADSAVLGYGAKYYSPSLVEEMKLVMLKNEHLKLTMESGSVFSFRGQDALNLRTHVPISRGAFIAGRLPFTIDGNKVDDISTGVAHIVVTVRDYLNIPYTVEFRGTGHAKLPVYMSGEPLDPSQQVGMRPPESKVDSQAEETQALGRSNQVSVFQIVGCDESEHGIAEQVRVLTVIESPCHFVQIGGKTFSRYTVPRSNDVELRSTGRTRASAPTGACY